MRSFPRGSGGRSGWGRTRTNPPIGYPLHLREELGLKVKDAKS